MTGRGLQPGRRWLAGFLAVAAMVGWWVGVPGGVAGKDACPPERAGDTSLPVGDTAAFGSGTIAYNRQRPDGSLAGIWVADPDGANPVRVAGTGSRPVWSPDGKRIAYEEWTGGEVWVMDADGANPLRLASNAANPVWSPDGTRILYRGVPWPDYGIWPGEVDLWVVDMDGSNRRLVATGGPHPVWSPDGSRILYRAGGGSRDWWVVDVDGTDRRRIGTAAVWSPDGSRIVHSGGDGMFVSDAAGGSSRRVAGAGSWPRWWPDDTEIFYIQAGALWVVGADGSNRRQLGTGLGAASLSPDATRIAWSGEDGGVWVMNTDGSGRKQLTRDGWRPGWAPDGSRLFATYHDFEGWPLGLVVVDTDGSVLAEITPGNVFEPVWLPDSRSVAYSADGVFIVDVDGGIRRLTDHDTFETITCLVLSPAGDQLAYETGGEVFVVNTDGTGRTRLDRSGECPTWPPG